jgi:hypothetical protein
MEWYSLKSFPNHKINMIGQVISNKTGKILSQSLSPKGYYQINIDKKSRRVHRLLAETFIPNLMNYETVNHINGNKIDNSLTNLEWLSIADNIKHAREVLNIKTIPYSKKKTTHHLIGKTGFLSTSGKKVKATLKNGEEKIYGSCTQASRELFNNEQNGKMIRHACLRKKNKFYKNIKFEEYTS